MVQEGFLYRDSPVLLHLSTGNIQFRIRGFFGWFGPVSPRVVPQRLPDEVHYFPFPLGDMRLRFFGDLAVWIFYLQQRPGTLRIWSSLYTAGERNDSVVYHYNVFVVHLQTEGPSQREPIPVYQHQEYRSTSNRLLLLVHHLPRFHGGISFLPQRIAT